MEGFLFVFLFLFVFFVLAKVFIFINTVFWEITSQRRFFSIALFMSWKLLKAVALQNFCL